MIAIQIKLNLGNLIIFYSNTSLILKYNYVKYNKVYFKNTIKFIHLIVFIILYDQLLLLGICSHT